MAGSSSPVGVDVLEVVAGSNFTTGAAGRAGTATLVAGTATISTTAVTANSIVLLSRKLHAGAPIGADLECPTRTVATSFVVNSIDVATGATVATDTSTFDWLVIN